MEINMYIVHFVHKIIWENMQYKIIYRKGAGSVTGKYTVSFLLIENPGTYQENSKNHTAGAKLLHA